MSAVSQRSIIDPLLEPRWCQYVTRIGDNTAVPTHEYVIHARHITALPPTGAGYHTNIEERTQPDVHNSGIAPYPGDHTRTNAAHQLFSGSAASDINKLRISMYAMAQTCMSCTEGFKFKGDPAQYVLFRAGFSKATTRYRITLYKI